jgi:membrane associated rhomboid family serine protease
MFRRRGENLHSIYIFLFLNILFFVLQFQDQARYMALFAFNRDAVLAGEYWRILTYQFIQLGGFFIFSSPAISLFFSLVILYIMGGAVEEEWGTFNFVSFYLISTLVSAGAAALLNVPIFGTFFISYSLLFVYATLFPDTTFYVMYVLPVQVKWIAFLVLAMLCIQVFGGRGGGMAAMAGAAASYAFFLLHRSMPSRGRKMPQAAADTSADNAVAMATKNTTRWTAIKNAVSTRSDSEIDRLIAQSQKDIVAGVNICPPADYKPEAADRYCVRCDGFAECSARYLQLNRPKAEPPADGAPVSS